MRPGPVENYSGPAQTSESVQSRDCACDVRVGIRDPVPVLAPGGGSRRTETVVKTDAVPGVGWAYARREMVKFTQDARLSVPPGKLSGRRPCLRHPSTEKHSDPPPLTPTESRDSASL
jgi:hypothetical protein